MENEKKNPLSELMHSAVEMVHQMADTNTIVGQPITTLDGVTLIPVSRLSFGFATGGSDFGKTQNVAKNFGGGAGAGGGTGSRRSSDRPLTAENSNR